MRRLPNLPSSLFIGLMALAFVPRAGAYPRVPFQSTAILQGRVLDQNGAVVPHAKISAQNIGTGLVRAGETDSEGNYVSGPVEILGRVVRWFATSAFTSVARFGSLGRNVIIGPGFKNLDFSVLKNLKLDEKMRLQIRAEVFDLLNHPSFGQPGRVVGSATFGQISNTRFPTGDSGSSRQLQFALKLMF